MVITGFTGPHYTNLKHYEGIRVRFNDKVDNGTNTLDEGI